MKHYEIVVLVGLVLLGGAAISSVLGGGGAGGAGGGVRQGSASGLTSRRSVRGRASGGAARSARAPRPASSPKPGADGGGGESFLAGPQTGAVTGNRSETVLIEARRGAAAALEGERAVVGEQAGLRLQVAYAREGEALTVRYRLRNNGSEPVYVFTPLSRYDFEVQAWRPDPSRVYSRQSKEGTLELSKRLVQIPRGVSVFHPQVPALTRLRPGVELRETVRLALPLRLESPYANARRRGRPLGKLRPARAVMFSIGYLKGLPASALTKIEGQERFRVGYGHARRGQRVLRSGKVSLSVAVR